MKGMILFMTLNFAHRGASGYYPENTILAFEKAVELGCDGIETDVQLTKDGITVLCHDEKIDRTTNGTGFIKDYTYSELCQFDAGIKFGDTFRDLRLPVLDDILRLAKDTGLIVNLELKNNIIEYEGLEEKVIDKIRYYGLQGKIIISSFNHYSVMKCRKLDSEIKTGFLYSNSLYDPGFYGSHAGVNALHPNYNTLKGDVIENIHSHGLEINTYTVNSEEHMKLLIESKVEGIITNYPDILSKLLK